MRFAFKLRKPGQFDAREIVMGVVMGARPLTLNAAGAVDAYTN